MKKGIVCLALVVALLPGCEEPASTSGADRSGDSGAQEARSGAAGEAGGGENAEEAAPRNPAKSGRTPPPVAQFAYGIPVPGKEGFVFNPWRNNPVDVRGIPPGTLVVDPMDPAGSDHKFRVPRISAEQKGPADTPVITGTENYPEARRHPDNPEWVINPISGEAIDVGALPDGAMIIDPSPDSSTVFRIVADPEKGTEGGS